MRKKVIGILATAMLFLSGALVGIVTYHEMFPPVIRIDLKMGGTEPGMTVPDASGFAPLFEAWLMINGLHFSPPTPEQVINGAIDGMVRSTGDRHTRYVPPVNGRPADESQPTGFSGIGASVTIQDDLPTVTKTMPGSPARQAGLLPGDAIERIDGTPTKALSLEQAISLIRGPVGTQVTLTVRRSGESGPLQIAVTRAHIENRNVTVSMITHNGRYLAHVVLNGFTDESPNELSTAFSAARAAGAKGLILDLRDNGGGAMHACRQIASAWIGRKTATWVYDRRGRAEALPALELRGLTGTLHGMPTVLLMNRHSASASEMLAGALRDHGEARLVGEKSFGKGSVQIVKLLSNNGRLRLTIQHFRSPSKRVINGQGLTPDIAVEMTPADIRAGRDPQLSRALDTLAPRQCQSRQRTLAPGQRRPARQRTLAPGQR